MRAVDNDNRIGNLLRIPKQRLALVRTAVRDMVLTASISNGVALGNLLFFITLSALGCLQVLARYWKSYLVQCGQPHKVHASAPVCWAWGQSLQQQTPANAIPGLSIPASYITEWDTIGSESVIRSGSGNSTGDFSRNIAIDDEGSFFVADARTTDWLTRGSVRPHLQSVRRRRWLGAPGGPTTRRLSPEFSRKVPVGCR